MKNILTIIVLALLMSTAYAQTNKRVVAKKPQTSVRKPQTTVRKTTTTARKPVARKTATAKPAAPVKKSKLDLCPDNKHPHAIDLGLPSGTCWSCCNVGAEIPEEFGGLYAWGELKEKRSFWLNNYKYYDNGSGDNSYNYNFPVWDLAGTEYDVAHVQCGGEWETPNPNMMRELTENCIFEYITIDSISGAKFTGPNGNSIFLPAAGYGNSKGRDLVGTGHYSVSQTGSNKPLRWQLSFYGDGRCKFDFVGGYGIHVYLGTSIRPIKGGL